MPTPSECHITMIESSKTPFSSYCSTGSSPSRNRFQFGGKAFVLFMLNRYGISSRDRRAHEPLGWNEPIDPVPSNSASVSRHRYWGSHSSSLETCRDMKRKSRGRALDAGRRLSSHQAPSVEQLKEVQHDGSESQAIQVSNMQTHSSPCILANLESRSIRDFGEATETGGVET